MAIWRAAIYIPYYLMLCCGLRPRHRHDYDMEFTEGLDYVLRCECGDTAPDMGEALRRMNWGGRS